MSEVQTLREALPLLLEQPRHLVLFALLLLAAVIDWRSLRIPNWLTGSGAVLGLLLSMLAPAGSQLGLGFALGGLALGLLLMLPMYLLGVMGAGDVKLMAMAGTYLGVPHTLHATLFVFVAGGVMALAAVLMRQAGPVLLVNLGAILARWPAAWRQVSAVASRPSLGKMPYGVSICAGTVVYVLSHQLGYV